MFFVLIIAGKPMTCIRNIQKITNKAEKRVEFANYDPKTKQPE